MKIVYDEKFYYNNRRKHGKLKKSIKVYCNLSDKKIGRNIR